MLIITNTSETVLSYRFYIQLFMFYQVNIFYVLMTKCFYKCQSKRSVLCMLCNLCIVVVLVVIFTVISLYTSVVYKCSLLQYCFYASDSLYSTYHCVLNYSIQYCVQSVCVLCKSFYW